MNTIKCLHCLDLEEFQELIEKELKLTRWYVYNDTLQNRTEAIQNTPRYRKIRKTADENNIQYDDKEVITWFDSLNLLYYAIKGFHPSYFKEHVYIIQEYCIPFTNKRADYLIVYQNKILILEFSFNKLGYAFNYEKKLNQAKNYKELLSSRLPNEIEIGIHTIIVDAEKENNGHTLIHKEGTDEIPNEDKIKDLTMFISLFFKRPQIELNPFSKIKKFFKKDRYLALQSLLDLSEQIGENE